MFGVMAHTELHVFACAQRRSALFDAVEMASMDCVAGFLICGHLNSN
jgi:hypothetical protein